MQALHKIAQIVAPFIPLAVAVAGSVAFLWGMHWLLIGRHEEIGKERKFSRQLVMLGLSLVSIVVITLTLPVSESSRNQLIALIGLLVSGIIAFSSATVVSNLMAGILIRITKPFHAGDFIRVGEFFGRVSEKGLFDTVVQAESRELIAFPNSYLTSNPVSTVLNSGAIVAASLSLGYDAHHSTVESLLVKAAREAGLEDPFVHIMQLGDYSVTYRVSGVLTEVKGIITARSNLNRAVLDTLHENGIEIMSPSYMNQRRLPETHSTIPATPGRAPAEKQAAAEDIVFDKAEEAARIEKEKQQTMNAIKQVKADIETEQDEDKKSELQEELSRLNERLKQLEQEAEKAAEENNGSEEDAAE